MSSTVQTLLVNPPPISDRNNNNSTGNYLQGGDADSSDDEFWYYEYEMVDEKKDDGEEEHQLTQQRDSSNRNVEVGNNKLLPPPPPKPAVSLSSIISTSPPVETDASHEEEGEEEEEETVGEEEITVVEEEELIDEDSTAAPPPPPSTGVSMTVTTATTATTTPQSMAGPSPSSSRKPFGVSVRKSLTPSQQQPSQSGPSPVILSPSKSRAQAASSAGLSELSKQLRILQAKNESQAVDIHRLERQLRILADLQGISVTDLRRALEDACASEALGEMQNRVSKLKFELEAATLAKQAELRKDTTAPHIANLELRVGELEEVEERQRAEIHHLYEQLRHERAKSTRLESENEQLRKELEDAMKRLQKEQARAARLEANMQDQMRAFQLEQAQKMQTQALLARQAADAAAAAASSSANRHNNNNNNNKSTTDGVNGHSSTASSVPSATSAKSASAAQTSAPIITPEMAAEYRRMVQLLKDKDEELRLAQARARAQEIEWVQRMHDVEEKARQAQMDIKVEHDKLALTVKELEDADGQSGLRLAQYKARFTVQDERIKDLEQQMDSLYTAFTLLKEEFDSDNVVRAAMLNNLTDADAEIARQAHKMEKQRSQNGGLDATPSSPSFAGRGMSRGTSAGSSHQLMPDVIASNTPSTAWATTPGSPSTPSRNQSRTNSGRGFETPGYDTTYQSGDSSGQGLETPISAYGTAEPYGNVEAYHPSPERTPSTWQLLFPPDHDTSVSSIPSVRPHMVDRLISGPLIVESRSMIRKWKTKPSRIYLRGDHYQWEIGDKRSFPLQFGISKVEFHPNYPLSFIVHLNPYDSMAPVIRAAVSTERDYHRWMAALTKATSGGDYQGGFATLESSGRFPPSPSRRSTMEPSSPSQYRPSKGRSSLFSSAGSDGSRRSIVRSEEHTVEEQEAADLKRILELSKVEV